MSCFKINICRAKIYCYAPRRIVRTNHSKVIVSLSKVHSTLVSRRCEVHVIPEVKDYTTPVVCKSNLIKSSSVSNPTLVVSKCNDIISVSLRQ